MTGADAWVRSHLVSDVLGWWATNGPDEVHGGVLTCWNNHGTELVATDKYTWSQGRWAWLTAQVAANAEALGVDGAAYRRWSRETSAFVREHAVLSDQRTAFVTTRTGEPFEPVPGRGLHTSIFADLFAALGFAGTAQLEPDEGWGDLALQILERSAEAIWSGPVRSDPYPVPGGHRSLALPMILTGVGQQVHAATGAEAAARVVRTAAGELTDHFLAGDDLPEMPPEDGSTDTLLARHRTPGHILELAWFLARARHLFDGPLADPARLARISLRALDIGWDSEYGGLLRFVDADGGQPTGTGSDGPYEAMVQSTWDTKLWWPHAEALYTVRLLADLTGNNDLAQWYQRLEDYTRATFPAGPGAEWVQIRDRTGAPLEETVALPVKDPFHIARALLLLWEHTND